VVVSLRAAAALALSVFVLTSAGSAQTKPEPVGRLDASSLFKVVSGSVVTITTQSGFGSGVIVDSSGVIATNLHVVRGDTKATVTLANHDTYDDVEVVDVDSRKDIVLLKVKAFKLPSLSLGDSEVLSVGNTVFAIGAPKGLELTLSEGIVSGLRDFGAGYRVIQTSAAISPGSSGGGLFNDRGELVGITTFQIVGGENLNFAVPINYVRGMLATTPKFTLADLATRYPSTSDARTHSGGERANEAGSEVSTELPPRLAAFYTTMSGSMAIFEQNGDTITSTWSHADGRVYGHSTFSWDATKKAFAGSGTMKAVCGQNDRRMTDASISEEIYLVNDRVIRERWTQPVKINCSKGIVESYNWEEMLWYVPPK
jgi:hypothetical protein